MKLIRTYLSAKPRSGSFSTALLWLMVMALASAIYFAEIPGISSLMPATREQVFSLHQYWRLLSAVLIHDGFVHLGSNAFFFVIFAYLLNGHFGATVFPGFVLLLGMLTHALTLLTYNPEVQLIGASGMVYAMGALWLSLYVLIERRFTLGRRLLLAVGVSLLLFAPQTFDPQVSYRAHAIGFAVGSVAGGVYFVSYRNQFRRAEVWEQPLSIAEELESIADVGPQNTAGPLV